MDTYSSNLIKQKDIMWANHMPELNYKVWRLNFIRFSILVSEISEFQ